MNPSEIEAIRSSRPDYTLNPQKPLGSFERVIEAGIATTIIGLGAFLVVCGLLIVVGMIAMAVVYPSILILYALVGIPTALVVGLVYRQIKHVEEQRLNR